MMWDSTNCRLCIESINGSSSWAAAHINVEEDYAEHECVLGVSRYDGRVHSCNAYLLCEGAQNLHSVVTPHQASLL